MKLPGMEISPCSNGHVLKIHHVLGIQVASLRLRGKRTYQSSDSCGHRPHPAWHSRCTIEAARRGHLDVLKFLCSKGLGLVGTEYYHAASKDH